MMQLQLPQRRRGCVGLERTRFKGWPICTHSVVDDIDLQVDGSFGWTGQLLVFQDVAPLLTVADLDPKKKKKKACFYSFEMHSDA